MLFIPFQVWRSSNSCRRCHLSRNGSIPSSSVDGSDVIVILLCTFFARFYLRRTLDLENVSFFII
jgi:hypothetical protein